MGKCNSWPSNCKADFRKSRLGSDKLLTLVDCHFLAFFLDKENERGRQI